MTVNVSGHNCTLADGVKEKTQTTGTGTYQLDGAVAPNVSFLTGIGNGNKTLYRSQLGSSWEIGVGTVASGAPPTIARTLVLKSSNADAAVNWQTGAKDIWVMAPAALLDQIRTTTLLGPIATTSGTAINFTALPSNAKRFTVLFGATGVNGNADRVGIQIGDSGGIENTGYLTGVIRTAPGGAIATSASGVAFPVVASETASTQLRGAVRLTLFEAGQMNWICEGIVHDNADNAVNVCAGSKPLSGTLDRIRVLTIAGSDSFDNGSVSLLVEG